MPEAKWRRPVRLAASPVLWTIALFLGAGRLDWARGWLTVTLYVVSMSLAGVIIHRANPGLMKARADWRRRDTKPFDKLFLRIFLPLTYLQPALAGLDAVRFRWSSMPAWLCDAGVLLYVLAIPLITWVMAVNPHAEATVRIQTDRGHAVVSSGPYRFVRHPMYVGILLMYPATALMLGSVWALVLAGVIAALFIWRTALEDGALLRELPGYEQYAARTRYRLLPGVW